MKQAQQNSEVPDLILSLKLDVNLPPRALQLLEENPVVSSSLVSKLLSVLVESLSYTHFPLVLSLVRNFEAELENNPMVMLQAAFAAWASGDHDDCEKWSRQVIYLAPNHAAGYLRLGTCYLTTQRFMDSFLTLSAGLNNANKDPQLIGWWHLAERMARGSNEVVFEKWGEAFKFRMTCFNTQAMESDAAHLGGRFTEEGELDYLKSFLIGCKNFVEIGVLVGNHSVCLATLHKPDSYLIVDADSRSLTETAHNLELNRKNYPNTVFKYQECALAAVAGERVVISGREAVTVNLESLVAEKTDFIKIDIDGMEGALLMTLCHFLSTRRVKILIEVESQFQNDYKEKMALVGYQIVHRIEHGNYANLFLEYIA